MSNLYVTEAVVNARLGSRAAALLDRSGDGSADSGLLASIIESMGRVINMRLRQRYGSAVPFAEIGDATPTPEEIQEIALHLVLWDVYKWHEPDGRDAVAHFSFADTALTSLLEGDFDLGNVDRAAAHEGRHIMSATYEAPIVGGVDSSGLDRLKGV